MEEIANNQQENNKETPEEKLERLKRIGFQPGQSGNPAGRPKGKTIKERVREWLEDNPEDMGAFVKHFVEKNRDLAWQMLEGRPSQQLQGDPDNPLVQIVFDKAFEKKEDSDIAE